MDAVDARRKKRAAALNVSKPSEKNGSKPGRRTPSAMYLADGTSKTSVAVRHTTDGAYLICDPELPLIPGCKVCVFYPPEAKNKKRTASWVGTLRSVSKKTRIAWVIFPMEDGGERIRRFDLGEGYDIARVTGVFTPLPVRDDPRLTGMVRS